MLIRTAGLPFSRLNALSADWKTVENALQVGWAQRSARAAGLQTALDTALMALEESPLRTAVYKARKDFYRREKVPAAHFFNQDTAEIYPELKALQAAVNDFNSADEQYRHSLAAFEQAYETTLTQAYACLQTIAGEAHFQRALLFSSHALLRQLPHFQAKSPLEFAKKERQTALAVLQYATRMAVKTSPLSRFTSVSMQMIGEQQEHTVAEMPGLMLETFSLTPNAALLEALYAVLLQEPVFYRALPLALNPCITAVSTETYHFLFFNGEHESFQEIAADPLLNHLTQFLLEQDRQQPFEALLDELSQVADAERQDLEVWLLELIDLGFLEWVLPEPGLTPGWCGNLYRFLGYLPAAPLVVDAAALLQWLRTAARTMPYQPVLEARQTQEDALRQLQLFFEKYRFPVPPLPPEQVFYEDAVQTASGQIPQSALTQIVDQLADCWQQRPECPLPEGRAKALNFAKEKIEQGGQMDFLDFCRAFIYSPTVALDTPNKIPAFAPPRLRGENEPSAPQKIGALLQPFQENGQWYAVVNGLYPGGGKLFARWLHLFAPEHTALLRQWLHAPSTSELTTPNSQLPTPNSQLQTSNSQLPTPNSQLKTQKSKIPFPWQGYFNANFQPVLSENALLVPGGRLRASTGAQGFLIGNLELYWAANELRLRDRVTGQGIELTELGLEALETRPPAMQLLWQLGMPFISLEALLPADRWQVTSNEKVYYQARICFQNIVLARAAWSIGQERWQSWLEQSESGLAFFKQLRAAFSKLGLPRYFFARFGAEKPQFFDLDSPLLMQLFEKLLRQGGGALVLTEMLPLPNGRQGQQVQELVVEFSNYSNF